VVFKHTSNTPLILLVNPWIHDFAAYDFWARPYGLLSLAAILREAGVRVSYVDCLDRFHPSAPPADPLARHGRGPYRKTPLPTPPSLGGIRRTFSRYGIEPQWLIDSLRAMERPDLILVTSLMTYWYPGVFETIGVLKQVFPNVPVVLGGIYARLWPEHARAHSGADLVSTSDGRDLFDIVARLTGFDSGTRFDWGDLNRYPYPAFDLQRRVTYIPLLTGRGCPFDCAYCAASFLETTLRRRSPALIAEEIAHWHRNYGVVDFAFYDDALLVDAERHALPLLETIIRQGLPLRFHTPNALHIRAISAEVARLMARAGFRTLRLGLETTAFEQRSQLDRKVTEAELRRAVAHLAAAGFAPERIGAYLLVGLPGQSLAAVETSIAVVKALGLTPVLAHYTPIPHTRLWPAAVAASRYDLTVDPIFSNNALMPCRTEAFSWQTLSRLKQLAAR
jgi:radical SAM superfamily enzyme YgiQ (UPF0313 family)